VSRPAKVIASLAGNRSRGRRNRSRYEKSLENHDVPTDFEARKRQCPPVRAGLGRCH
jgi:hypothetical protein